MQTGQYSTQIFSLAVLLSSLFIYNQMGGIDEAALDRLSLVTEMTKHIRVRSEGAAGVVLSHHSTCAHLQTFSCTHAGSRYAMHCMLALQHMPHHCSMQVMPLVSVPFNVH